MQKGGKVLLSSLVLLVLGAALAVSPVTAQLTVTDPVGSEDTIPPGPVANLSATADLVDISVTLNWDLSEDDYIRQVPAGTDFTSGGTFVNINDVAAYHIWRQDGEAEAEVVGSVGHGVAVYEDTEVTTGITYVYMVTAVDASGNESTPVATDPITLGPPLIGDFNGDNTVDLLDFFLFAEMFGKTPEDPEYDPQFDLAAPEGIGLSDFFVFAEWFGRSFVDGVIVDQHGEPVEL